MRGRRAVALIAAGALGGCGGGGGTSATVAATPSAAPLYTAPAPEALTAADVGTVVAQAVAEATARNLPAVIAVSDRVGNVLAVFTMTGARATATIPLPAGGTGLDAQGLAVPAAAAAISKALTGAYLSSGGNAFTTRTASEIVQERFPPTPAAAGLESGPLFGVQFSQLPCSDLAARYTSAGGPGAAIGPKRAPLGLAADPGGVPLYKNGVLVGGVGVMADEVYGFDADIADRDDDAEEGIALAGQAGFAPPAAITADRLAVDGTTLRYADTAPRTAAGATFASVSGRGALTPVRGYYAETGTPALLAGQVYGAEASGVRAATAAEFGNADAWVLTDGAGADRYPIVAGSDGADIAQPLTAAESRALLERAFAVMGRARAQIRQPLDSRAQVSIALVDTRGQALGLVRAPDAPLFGADVALQKARSAAFVSGRAAATDLAASGSADVRGFVAATRVFLGDATALTGASAFTTRAIGNLARPYFPDGEIGRPAGPLSRPIAQWSIFSTGLQSALVAGNLGQHLAYVQGGPADTPRRCGDLPLVGGAARLANGLQIFAGGVPIYRGAVLVGAIGVSGDGIDGDDLIAFLGVAQAAAQVGGIGEAPDAIRSDRLVIGGARLRYVGCPVAPYLDAAEQNVCSGR